MLNGQIKLAAGDFGFKLLLDLFVRKTGGFLNDTHQSELAVQGHLVHLLEINAAASERIGYNGDDARAIEAENRHIGAVQAVIDFSCLSRLSFSHFVSPEGRRLKT